MFNKLFSRGRSGSAPHTPEDLHVGPKTDSSSAKITINHPINPVHLIHEQQLGGFLMQDYMDESEPSSTSPDAKAVPRLSLSGSSYNNSPIRNKPAPKPDEVIVLEESDFYDSPPQPQPIEEDDPSEVRILFDVFGYFFCIHV